MVQRTLEHDPGGIVDRMEELRLERRGRLSPAEDWFERGRHRPRLHDAIMAGRIAPIPG